MPQSLCAVYVHAVFSTSGRNPWILEPERLHAHLGEVSKRLGYQPLIVGGITDHVHILAAASRTLALADWIKELKRVSSVFMKSSVEQFSWQKGYGVFSVTSDQISTVRQYIANQAEHHRQVDFQSELRALLAQHGLDFDERYLWE